jgi:hypothetical protein
MHRSELLLLASTTLVQAMVVTGARAAESSGPVGPSAGATAGGTGAGDTQTTAPVTYTPIVRTQGHSNGRVGEVVPALPSTVEQPAEVQVPPSARHWYGGQVLIVDGASLAVGFGAAAVGNSDTGLMMMAGGWVLGAPIVHAAHHRAATALASLAMRATFSLVGWYSGGPCRTTCTTAVGSCADDPNASDHWQTTTTTCNGTIGLMLGGILASAIDSTFLSWERIPSSAVVETAPRAASPAHRWLSIDSAGVVPMNAGAGLSLGGSF